jgi:hypothetical protein
VPRPCAQAPGHARRPHLTSATAAADAQAMTDRDCHVASAVDGKAAGGPFSVINERMKL